MLSATFIVLPDCFVRGDVSEQLHLRCYVEGCYHAPSLYIMLLLLMNNVNQH